MQKKGLWRELPGFTLVEMLVVVLIIFILVGITLAVGMQVQSNSQIQLTKMELRNLQSALNWYHHKTGVYPATMADFLVDYQRMHAYQTTGSVWLTHPNVLSQLPAQNVVTGYFTSPGGTGSMAGVAEVLDGFGTPIQYCPPPPTSTTPLWPQISTQFSPTFIPPPPPSGAPLNAVYVNTTGDLSYVDAAYPNGTFPFLAATSNGHGAFFYSLGVQYATGGIHSAPVFPSDYMYSYAP